MSNEVPETNHAPPSAAAPGSAAPRSTQHERADGRVFLKRLDVGEAGTKQSFHLGGRAVSHLYPEHLRWAASHNTEVVVLFVLPHDGESIQPGVFPNLIIVRAVQALGLYMAGTGEQVSQTADQIGRQVLIEEQLHATATSMVRSRSAAKPKQAWMSSCVRYGKSSRTSATVIPAAR